MQDQPTVSFSDKLRCVLEHLPNVFRSMAHNEHKRPWLLFDDASIFTDPYLSSAFKVKIGQHYAWLQSTLSAPNAAELVVEYDIANRHPAYPAHRLMDLDRRNAAKWRCTPLEATIRRAEGAK